MTWIKAMKFGGTCKCLSSMESLVSMRSCSGADWGSRLLMHMKAGPVPEAKKKDPYKAHTMNRKRTLLVLQEWGMSMEGLDKMRLQPQITDLSTYAVKSKLRWLMDWFGFTKLQVVRVVRSNPPLLSLSIEENVLPFMQLFRTEGLSMAEVRSMIISTPQLLGSANKFSLLEKCLAEYLDIDRPQAVALVAKCPKILLNSGIKQKIKNMVGMFADSGIDEQKVSLMVRKCPDLLLMSLDRDLQPIVEQFLDLSISREDVSTILTEAPSLLCKCFDTFVNKKLQFLVEEAGFSKEDALGLLVRDPKKFRDSLHYWRNTHRWMLEKGLNLETAREFIQKNMSFLSRSSSSLEEKFLFASQILGKQNDEIMKCPRYFNASFEDVIVFRAAFLREKGDDCTQRALGHIVSSNGIFNKRHGYDAIESFRKTWSKLNRSQKLAQFGK